jgi:hypothetical protein
MASRLDEIEDAATNAMIVCKISRKLRINKVVDELKPDGHRRGEAKRESVHVLMFPEPHLISAS